MNGDSMNAGNIFKYSNGEIIRWTQYANFGQQLFHAQHNMLYLSNLNYKFGSVGLRAKVICEVPRGKYKVSHPEGEGHL